MSAKKPAHIYWFAYYNLDSPSVRYRARYPLQYAREKLGISSSLVLPGYSIHSLWRFTVAYLSALLFPKKDSLVVIQRVQSNFIYAKLLKLLVLVRMERCIYDLDDADYLEHEPGTIHFFARHCQAISAGSPEIIRYLTPFNSRIQHTTSPTPDLGIIKKHRNKTFTIGWIGGFGWGHRDSLLMYLFPALREMTFNCRLVLIGILKDEDRQEIAHYFRDHENVEIVLPEQTDWNDERAIQEMIAGFDVGIATLLNHPVQLAKSGIKAKQYMNNGIPVICNDLPENNQVVVDQCNGFICDTASQFRDRLTELRNMHDEQYWQFSTNARHSVQDFNHPKFLEDLFHLISKNPKFTDSPVVSRVSG